MKKTLIKRFKIKKTGKILVLPAGQNHFRSKKSGKKIRQKRKHKYVPKEVIKQIKKRLK